eukprot:12778661-Ditylum_brightwellii.AAC.1
MLKTPPEVHCPDQQKAETVQLHKDKEITKWCRTSWAIDCDAQQRTLQVKKKTIPGDMMIRDLLKENVLLVPATIDPFMCNSSALCHVMVGTQKKPIDLTEYDFKKVKGVKEGKQMAQRTMGDQ